MKYIRRVIVFVYGSLLQGEEHHGALGGAPFRGAARTAPRYALVDLGRYPGLAAGDASVSGELYDVEEAAIGALDEFEGHPVDYVRCEIELSDGRAAFAYLLPEARAAGGDRVASGDWRAHRRLFMLPR